MVIIFILAGAAMASAKDVGPLSVNVRYYGSFKKMIQENHVEGIVELDRALSAPHVYALGIIKNAEGEITALDGEVWLNYGKDGISKTVNQLKKGEKASLLITANVEKWQTMIVPDDMSESELFSFVFDQAKKIGLNMRAPFPFLIEGRIRKVVWEVLDGTDTDQTKKSSQVFLRKLVGYREEAPVVLLGFYPGELHNELDYPGELWHIHAVFKDDNNTGHVNAFSVTKGFRLLLPAR